MYCEYCENGKPLFNDDGDGIVITQNELFVALYAYEWATACCEISFCPMCGRDLRGDDQ